LRRINLPALRAELAKPDLDPGRRREGEEILRQLEELYEANPLQGFYPHSKPQRGVPAGADPDPGGVRRQPVRQDDEQGRQSVVSGRRRGLPTRPPEAGPVPGFKSDKVPSPAAFGRIVVPDLTATLEGVLLPAFRKWTPKAQLRGGAFDKAWDKTRRILYFANGSWIQCMTYEMDLDKFGGAAMHFIGYDEPPPKDIRTECLYRLADFGGFEMFAMTPLMGIGWIYRDIFKKREHPDITVIRGSMHDNPTLDTATKDRILARPTTGSARAASSVTSPTSAGWCTTAGSNRNLIDRPGPGVRQDPGRGGRDRPGDAERRVRVGRLRQEQNGFVFHEEYLRTGHHRRLPQGDRPREQALGGTHPVVRDRPVCEEPLTGRWPERAGRAPGSGDPDGAGQNSVQAGRSAGPPAVAVPEAVRVPECRGLRDEAEEYRIDEKKTDESAFAVVKQGDHRCFAPDTMVATEHGVSPIESVRAGVRVWTTAGLRPVLAAGLTAVDAQVYDLELSDGSAVTATGNHPFWVQGKGWTTLDTVRYGDIMLVWPEAKSSPSTASSSAGTQIPSAAATACTSRPESATSNEVSDASTKRFGWRPTAQSHGAGTSTTRTRTPSTTSSTTSTRFHRRVTRLSTGPMRGHSVHVNTLTGSGRWRLNGTAVPRVARGTAAWLVKHSKAASRWNVSAISAVRTSAAWAVASPTGSVPTHVSRRGAARAVSTTSIVSAPSAVRPSELTSTARSQLVLARVVAVRKAGRSAVYNLTVDGEHEFFANGVLVHNCDALRYACMARRWLAATNSESTRPLGHVYGSVPAWDGEIDQTTSSPPLGAMS
jgi:phage terminase large subunit-like protein